MEKFWHSQGRELKYKDNVLSVEHHTYRFIKADRSMPFTVVNTNDWVVIIPEISGGRFALVKQYRVGVSATTLEFPGGAVSSGEDPLNAARRELEEETGLVPAQMTFLGKINPNPAFISNTCHAYFASKCTYGGRMNLDLFEDIEVEEQSVYEFENLIAKGVVTHSIVLAAYTLYSAYRKSQ